MKIQRIAEGEDVVAALAREGGSAWVQANGALEDVELRAAGDAPGPTRALRGTVTLVTLLGRATGPLTATLARATDAGLETLAGEIVRAKSAGVVVFVQFSEGPASAEGSAGEIPTDASWAAVAKASDAATESDADESIPEPGDLVDHFSFGLCEVLMSDGDRLRIRDVRGAHRVREVALAMLDVAPPTTSGDKRLFRLRRKT